MKNWLSKLVKNIVLLLSTWGQKRDMDVLQLLPKRVNNDTVRAAISRVSPASSLPGGAWRSGPYSGSPTGSHPAANDIIGCPSSSSSHSAPAASCSRPVPPDCPTSTALRLLCTLHPRTGVVGFISCVPALLLVVARLLSQRVIDLQPPA